jgi:hypothetical protein
VGRYSAVVGGDGGAAGLAGAPGGAGPCDVDIGAADADGIAIVPPYAAELRAGTSAGAEAHYGQYCHLPPGGVGDDEGGVGEDDDDLDGDDTVIPVEF